MKDKYYNNNTVEPVEKKYIIKGVTIVIAFILFITLLPSLFFIPLFQSLSKEYRNYLNVKKQCDITVQGTVVDYKEWVNHDYEDNRDSTGYAPIVAYEYNGNEYKYESRYFTSGHKLGVGTNVEMRINSDNAEIAYLPSYKGDVTFAAVGTVIGVIIYSLFAISTVIVVISIIMLIIRRKKA